MNTIVNNLQDHINHDYLTSESEMIRKLLSFFNGDYDATSIHHQAYSLVSEIRKKKDQQSFVEAFLNEYQLNSEEGIVLLSIAEALLRIPDCNTQDLFLQEKLSKADWGRHIQHSDSLLVNFSTLALNISGQVENFAHPTESDRQQIFSSLSSRIGIPIIRNAIRQAMQQLSYQFVIAETIEETLIKASHQTDYLYSFDMLGEAALTTIDEERYFNAYIHAIKQVAKHATNKNPLLNPGISIKLSALCCRYEPLQYKQAVQQISSKLLLLTKKARAANISVTIDAEESERLQMSLAIFNQVISDPSLKGWSGFGLAVQAYQKRSFDTLHWLASLAKSLKFKIPIRLVKGAYWDSEIKRAQIQGLSDYPVFTHKSATDLSYLVCSKFILSHPDEFYPQFATHNAQTVAAILELAKNQPSYEFQRLHGMGEQLYNQILKQTGGAIACRIYAPVGSYKDLLPYLVRRLLENGANTSFINQLDNVEISIEKVVSDPVNVINNMDNLNSQILLPMDLYGKKRINSEGTNLADQAVLAQLQQNLRHLKKQTWQAMPLVNAIPISGEEHPIYNPAKTKLIVGSVIYSSQQAISETISVASSAFKHWRLSKVQQRSSFLLKAAELLQQNQNELVSLCIREAGKTLTDAFSEIREAIDFCRYYAQLAINLFENPLTLPGPTGENNRLYHYGRGVFVCISPWNFPIAIFVGQITAALASGNTVIAMPASQTNLTAMRCIQLLHKAGIPEDVLHFLPGDGATVGQHLLSDNRIAGVAFTGSLATAQLINQQLARNESIIPFIAETGGQNVMVADSSAHVEQLVQDVVRSAFNSAGQRCSALRVLFIPDEIAESIIARIIGVMEQLVVGDPENFDTDIGPVINQQAVDQLTDHVKEMHKQAKLLFQTQLKNDLESPCFFPPTLIELNSLSQLKQENFGPILHITRYHPSDLAQVIEAINASGYGLTLGIHSRIKNTINTIAKNCKVGNVYVNRNMIGAVVGVQPFGGMGLSGTGPKAGGPHYLQRFVNEQTVTTNTAAIGGNTSLLTQGLQ